MSEQRLDPEKLREDSGASSVLDLTDQTAVVLELGARASKIAALQRRAETAEADNVALIHVLGSLRWSGLVVESPTHYHTCPVCKSKGRNFSEPDHREGCAYALVMDKEHPGEAFLKLMEATAAKLEEVIADNAKLREAVKRAIVEVAEMPADVKVPDVDSYEVGRAHALFAFKKRIDAALAGQQASLSPETPKLVRSLCRCELHLRRWNPLTKRCETCGDDIAPPDGGRG